MKICFDVETTGLNPDVDEILQISIIDDEGNILIDSYVRPVRKESWEEAMNVNGITPALVKNAPTAQDLWERVQMIFDKADTVISYNGSFDLQFLKHWGVELSDQEHIDVMIKFANYYKEVDERHPGEYRWKKLTFAAAHFGYDWEEQAHNSLGDVMATMYVNEKLDELQVEGTGL